MGHEHKTLPKLPEGFCQLLYVSSGFQTIANVHLVYKCDLKAYYFHALWVKENISSDVGMAC